MSVPVFSDSEIAAASRRFFKLHCAGDLLNTELFPTVAHMAEAMRVRDALVRRYDPKDASIGVSLFRAGSSHIAAFIAFTTHWDTVCVDSKVPKGDVSRFSVIARLADGTWCVTCRCSSDVIPKAHIMLGSDVRYAPCIASVVDESLRIGCKVNFHSSKWLDIGKKFSDAALSNYNLTIPDPIEGF